MGRPVGHCGTLAWQDILSSSACGNRLRAPSLALGVAQTESNLGDRFSNTQLRADNTWRTSLQLMRTRMPQSASSSRLRPFDKPCLHQRVVDEPLDRLRAEEPDVTARIPVDLRFAPVLPESSDLVAGVDQSVGDAGVDEAPLRRYPGSQCSGEIIAPNGAANASVCWSGSSARRPVWRPTSSTRSATGTPRIAQARPSSRLATKEVT